MFPLKINEETYYAGMGEYERRYVVSFNSGTVIARDNYLKPEHIHMINEYVTDLENKIKSK